MKRQILILVVSICFSHVSFTQQNCSQVLSYLNSIKFTSLDLDKKIKELTILKILWDMRETGSLSQAQLTTSKYFPSREQELLSATGMSKEDLINRIKHETRNQQSRIDELTEEKGKRSKKENEIFDPYSWAKKPVFHLIKTGKFIMGYDVLKQEKEITKSYWMMDTAVTQMMWARLSVAMGIRNSDKINPSHFKTGKDSVEINNFEKTDLTIVMQPNHPVEEVSYEDMIKFIDGLNNLSNSTDQQVQQLLSELIPDHQKGDIYDLPSLEQWEFVMRNRGSANGEFYDLDDDSELSQYAWYESNSEGQTHAVATRLPRMVDGMPFYDLEGNVEEQIKVIPIDQKDTKAWPFLEFFSRGGNFLTNSYLLRSGVSNKVNTNPFEGKGFRLIRTRS
jgi:hypothetical protein